MSKISVIIPCYNTAQYVEETLQSVFNQTMQDIEIICVDDASPDNMAEVLKQYVDSNKIRYIRHSQNKGLAASRNTGIAAATGRFIYPLDSDDIIAPDCLEKLYKVITGTNYRIVGSQVQTFGYDNNFFTQPRLTKFEMYGKHESCVASALYYKSDWEKFGGYCEEFGHYAGEDMDFWLNYFDNNLPVYRVPEILFFYRTKSIEESYWKNFSKKEFIRRRKHKNNLLMHRHPQMRFYVQLYNCWRLGGKFIRLFYRKKTRDGYEKIKIMGITVSKRKVTEGCREVSNSRRTYA